MAKDPAYLFYSNDFDSKTKFFTHEQVGMYIRLMIAQHQTGHLTKKQMIFVCGKVDEDVFEKFTEDKEGKFYNERLEYEIERRKDYCGSRGKNRSGGKSKETETDLSPDQLPQLKREPLKPYIPETSDGTHADFATRIMHADFSLDKENIEVTAKKKLTVQILKEFNANCVNQSKVHPTFAEWKKHLSFWLPKQKEEIKTPTKYKELD